MFLAGRDGLGFVGYILRLHKYRMICRDAMHRVSTVLHICRDAMHRVSTGIALKQIFIDYRFDMIIHTFASHTQGSQSFISEEKRTNDEGFYILCSRGKNC